MQKRFTCGAINERSKIEVTVYCRALLFMMPLRKKEIKHLK